MHTVFCIDCGRPVSLESRPVEGETITCSNCGTDMEVISVEPTELDWVFLEPVQREEDSCWHCSQSRAIGST